MCVYIGIGFWYVVTPGTLQTVVDPATVLGTEVLANCMQSTTDDGSNETEISGTGAHPVVLPDGGVAPTPMKRRRRRVQCAVCGQSHQMRGARQFEACEHGVGMECLASVGECGQFFVQVFEDEPCERSPCTNYHST